MVVWEMDRPDEARVTLALRGDIDLEFADGRDFTGVQKITEGVGPSIDVTGHDARTDVF